MFFLLPDPTVPAKYISFPESHNDISSTERERDNKYKCSLHKLFYCRLFILFVLSRIKLVLHFVVNVIISVAERKKIIIL